MTLEPMFVVVVAANVLGAAMAVPQARKLVRERRSHGVSMTWAAVSATVNGWWAVYGLGVGDLSIVPVSVVSVLSYVIIAFAIARFSVAPLRRLVGPAILATLAVAALPTVVLQLDGWTSTGLVLGALYGIQLSPAVVTVYRSHDVSGVSLATWLIAVGEAALWGVYGFVRLDAGLLTLAATGVLMSSLVLLRLFLRRPRRTPAHVGAPAFAAA